MYMIIWETVPTGMQIYLLKDCPAEIATALKVADRCYVNSIINTPEQDTALEIISTWLTLQEAHKHFDNCSDEIIDTLPKEPAQGVNVLNGVFVMGFME